MEVLTMTNQELKSKAMSLGNRLAPRMDGDRSAAFVRAWQICKAGGLELAVRGVTLGSRQEALRRLAKYEPANIRAFVMPELENPADRNAMAVMVMVQGGRGVYKLGYVPANSTAAAAAVRGKASIKVIGCDIRGARLTLAV
jgi:hypothetical protein